MIRPLALSLAVLLGGGTLAQHVSDFVLERQEGMRSMDRALVTLGLMGEGLLPLDPDRARAAAVEIAVWSGNIATAFEDTPASRHGAASRARQEVWTDQGGFLTRMTDLEAASDALLAATLSGDPAVLTRSVRETRAVCDACHVAYLAPAR